jgi:pimeloyl-ACP methyl ester carboxylesterase
VSERVSPFEVATSDATLRGEKAGEGALVVLAHGLTATRRYVLHGSRALERAGHEVVSYDARGHGESDAAADGDYGYEPLTNDLAAVVDELRPATGDRVLLAGSSMGAHTIARFLLDNPGAASAAAFITPAFPGVPTPPESLERWDALADGLDRSGVDGFLEVYGQRDWPDEWREVVIRITRERLELHRDLHAMADALRGTPRSEPFDTLSDLGQIEIPVLVVASHDEADPGHQYSVAEAWAEAIPGSRLISEEPGASPLAWQGGRLARKLAAFFDSVG